MAPSHVGALAGLADERTIDQLAGIGYDRDSRGRIEIESKAAARRRPYVRAVRDEASPRLALRVLCAECCGRDHEAVIHLLHAPDSAVRVKREVLGAAEIGNCSWR